MDLSGEYSFEVGLCTTAGLSDYVVCYLGLIFGSGERTIFKKKLFQREDLDKVIQFPLICFCFVLKGYLVC